MKLNRSLVLTVLAISPTVAVAQGDATSPICTDRPTKANAACTVPAGRLQIESDLYNWARTKSGASSATSVAFVNPTLKYGLDSRSDLQVNWAPVVRIKTDTLGATTQRTDVGDVVVRYKRRLSADGARVQWGLIPFVKIPTAPLGVGNGRWEGGVAAPVNIALADGVTLTFGPEVDIFSEADGTGRRVNMVNLVNVAKAYGKATFYAEFWSATDFAAETGGDQRSVDFAVAYLLGPRLQVDLGVNIGLNPNTPDVQAYAGVSHRF
ncbi:MAG: transporter [Parvularculaceae bacterium]|nr:transporter [Parvularculaceae bacterium]